MSAVLSPTWTSPSPSRSDGGRCIISIISSCLVSSSPPWQSWTSLFHQTRERSYLQVSGECTVSGKNRQRYWWKMVILSLQSFRLHCNVKHWIIIIMNRGIKVVYNSRSHHTAVTDNISQYSLLHHSHHFKQSSHRWVPSQRTIILVCSLYIWEEGEEGRRGEAKTQF